MGPPNRRRRARAVVDEAEGRGDGRPPSWSLPRPAGVSRACGPRPSAWSAISPRAAARRRSRDRDAVDVPRSRSSIRFLELRSRRGQRGAQLDRGHAPSARSNSVRRRAEKSRSARDRSAGCGSTARRDVEHGADPAGAARAAAGRGGRARHLPGPHRVRRHGQRGAGRSRRGRPAATLRDLHRAGAHVGPTSRGRRRARGSRAAPRCRPRSRTSSRADRRPDRERPPRSTASRGHADRRRRLAALGETSLTQFAADGGFLDRAAATHRLTALDFTPAGLDTKPQLGGLPSEIVAATATASAMTARRARRPPPGIPFGTYAWRALESATTARYGAGVRDLLGAAVNCSAIATTVALSMTTRHTIRRGRRAARRMLAPACLRRCARAAQGAVAAGGARRLRAASSSLRLTSIAVARRPDSPPGSPYQ